MTREEIMEQLGADDWFTVAVTFRGLNVDDIKMMIDTMFPAEDNRDIARAIYSKLN